MNSLGFPKMFTGSSTVVKEGKEATLTCLKLLVGSEANTLFGDPDFGVKCKHYIYNQNDHVLKDILVDELYTKIVAFCPQVYLERKNIEITQKSNKLYATIHCKDQETFQNYTYNLVLFDEEGAE